MPSWPLVTDSPSVLPEGAVRAAPRLRWSGCWVTLSGRGVAGVLEGLPLVPSTQVLGFWISAQHLGPKGQTGGRQGADEQFLAVSSSFQQFPAGLDLRWGLAAPICPHVLLPGLHPPALFIFLSMLPTPLPPPPPFTLACLLHPLFSPSFPWSQALSGTVERNGAPCGPLWLPWVPSGLPQLTQTPRPESPWFGLARAQLG